MCRARTDRKAEQSEEVVQLVVWAFRLAYSAELAASIQALVLTESREGSVLSITL